LCYGANWQGWAGRLRPVGDGGISTEGEEGSAEVSRQVREYMGRAGCKTPMASCRD
jgi:hypothetical protein